MIPPVGAAFTSSIHVGSNVAAAGFVRAPFRNPGEPVSPRCGRFIRHPPDDSRKVGARPNTAQRTHPAFGAGSPPSKDIFPSQYPKDSPQFGPPHQRGRPWTERNLVRDEDTGPVQIDADEFAANQVPACESGDGNDALEIGRRQLHSLIPSPQGNVAFGKRLGRIVRRAPDALAAHVKGLRLGSVESADGFTSTERTWQRRSHVADRIRASHAVKCSYEHMRRMKKGGARMAFEVGLVPRRRPNEPTESFTAARNQGPSLGTIRALWSFCTRYRWHSPANTDRARRMIAETVVPDRRRSIPRACRRSLGSR
jgi:hypothetical protein